MATGIARIYVDVGDVVPDVLVWQGPDKKISLRELSVGKKVVLVGIPGAYTPTCSTYHVPGYVRDYDKLRAKGIDLIVCISVNDPYVMDAWGAALHADGKVVMVADPSASFTRALGEDMLRPMQPDDSLGTMQPRSRRYSALLHDGRFAIVNVEPAKGAVCSLSDVLITQL